jgi:acetolactate synthase-1/2/3 large subunit
MNGARSLLDTLLASGVDTCFANPGTSEMHFVAALDQAPGMRCVLGLHETIVTGMADGYWRIARKPACTLLHCGPGLANGLTNLHNARRARSGIVNVVGDQATYHRPHDPPLTADTEAMARTVSAWVRTSGAAKDVGTRCRRGGARSAHDSRAGVDADPAVGRVVGRRRHRRRSPARSRPAGHRGIGSGRGCACAPRPWCARADPAGRPRADSPRHRPWRGARRGATGAALLGEFGVAHVQRGRGRVPLERVPYVTDQAIEALARFEHIVLVNARSARGLLRLSRQALDALRPGAKLHVLSRLDQDPANALRALVDALKAPEAAIPDPGPRPEAAAARRHPRASRKSVAAGDARARDRLRRERLVRAQLLSRHPRRAAARLAAPGRRSDRRRAAGGHGGRDRVDTASGAS